MLNLLRGSINGKADNFVQYCVLCPRPASANYLKEGDLKVERYLSMKIAKRGWDILNLKYNILEKADIKHLKHF